MTMTIPWWIIPAFLFATGVVTSRRFFNVRGEWNITKGPIAAAIFFFFLALSIGFTIGRWVGAGGRP